MGKLIEGKAEILQSRPPGRAGAFKAGDRIFHDKFGYGVVEVVDGTSSTSRSRNRAARR